MASSLLFPPLNSNPSFDSTSSPALSRKNSNMGEDGLRNGAGNGSGGFDVGFVRSYLGGLLPPVFAASRAELESSLFDDPTFPSKAERFATDSSNMVAYVTQERNLRVGLEGEDGEEGGEVQQEESSALYTYTFHLPPTPAHTPFLISTLSLIKKKPILEPSIPLASQLHFVLLSTGNATSTNRDSDQQYEDVGGEKSRKAEGTDEGSTMIAAPYEGLHSVVHFGVTPWFDSYVSTKKVGVSMEGPAGKKGAEAQMGIPVAKRKFAELELSLLHLQQNVEIPETHLIIHPAISRAVEYCRTNSQRITIDAIQPSTLLGDIPFLNRLQSDVNLWIKEIQAVTKLNRDVASGSASQEVNFWLSLERALEGIETQLAGEEVQLTLSVLKSAKRFHATTSFVSDTGLKEATDTVVKYNALMRDFPLNELLSATELDKIRDSLYLVFGHLNKKLKVSPYPLRRTLPLVEAISSDFNEQCIKVLSNQRLMFLPYATFENVMAAAAEVFAAWDDNIKEFTNVAREVMRKRNEKFIAVKINSAHTKTQERVTYLRDFRRTHEQLRVMTGSQSGLKGLGGDSMTDASMEEEIKQAFESVKTAPVLDTTPEGTDAWIVAESGYNERVARVENQIISRLRDRLATARNAHEMFRIFSKFNSLFIRPKIRGAIQEYQNRLIDSVKEDIKKLHQKFTQSYRQSEAYHMSQLRDLPPVASAILWAKQIEKQLAADMKRVEDVLGKGWEMYAEGERLKTESESFRRKLDTTPIFEAWVQDVTRREQRVTGRLLEIVRQRNVPMLQNGQPALELAVNFDPQSITLFKEVRNLLWLNYSVPHTVVNYAKEAKRIYPHAVSLMESVRTYNQLAEIIDNNESVGLLVAQYRSRAQEMVVKGMNIRWETVAYSYGTPRTPATNGLTDEEAPLAFFREFATVVALLQDKVNQAIEIDTQIEGTLEGLGTCPYKYSAFAGHMKELQQLADKLNLEGYSNVDEWLDGLDAQVLEILHSRLQRKLDRWCESFENLSKDPSSSSSRSGVFFVGTHHELQMKNQVIYLEPPLQMAQASWLKQLQRTLGVICGQTRLKGTRYELTLRESAMRTDGEPESYMLSLLPDVLLERPLTLIRNKMQQIQIYVQRWLQLQSLWDLQQDLVYAQLGESLGNWSNLLGEIKRTRSTFDTADVQQDFGACTIAYANVQGKIAAKYDAWQRDILNRYGAKIDARMRDLYAQLLKARQELERQTISGSSTAQAVTFITFVQDLKRKLQQWTPDVAALNEGQRTLEKQRFAFPDGWLYAEQLQGEWGAFHEILKRKDATIQDQIAGLRIKVSTETKTVQERIDTLEADWTAHKPIQGGVAAEAALDAIQSFEGRVTQLQGEYGTLRQAQEALNLTASQDDRLVPILDELKDLRAVWVALSGVNSQLAELRETLWTMVQPRKLRATLDSILGGMRELPTRMRQYAAYEHVNEVIKSLIGSQPIVGELKGDALRERHWRQLFQVLRVARPYRESTLTLGNVYDLDLKRNEREIRDVCEQARGERNLEDYLATVKEVWSNYSLALTNYRNKCRLIKGWDELFAACSEHLAGLSAMRSSPYFRVFEEEANSWETRLNTLNNLFDVWVAVQRQWVYLEGIFSNNMDIKQLLPVESARFANIDSEFLTAMRKVYKSPLALDVLAIPSIAKTFERLAEALNKIQKALGEYLERERASFPRFYFLGDEDLLEIIGNSSDALRVTKHLKKMFAGIATLQTNEDDTVIQAMEAREGEVVRLDKPIVLAQYRKVNDWLLALEAAMRSTLAHIFQAALTALLEIFSTDTDLQASSLRGWLEAYPAQITVLAMQAAWTQLVHGRLVEGQSVNAVLDLVLKVLDVLAGAVTTDLDVLSRRKCEHLITELVHKRDVTRKLIQGGITSASDFEWLRVMRFYSAAANENGGAAVRVEMADGVFEYGFEYLGVPDRLVQTPLTDKCFLTLTQALHTKLGGSPFGPAGTGKTESVKALGVALGRYVLVFCCDESFDFQAMGRIFSGICQVGAWGCFDEFNRLEERMLSAVSQQIQSIQQALAAESEGEANEVVLADKKIAVQADTGIFVTMNPGYAGRSNLPDNLKKLFRRVAMSQPDRELIIQVMLYSQGFRFAEVISSKLVPFFEMCKEQLSPQAHYDFGLRALKAVLLRAGILKRAELISASDTEGSIGNEQLELATMVRSLKETLLPKLLIADVGLFEKTVTDVFPGIKEIGNDLSKLRSAISTTCAKKYLQEDDAWIDKIVQLYQVQQVSHGVMLVGPAATGKSQAWEVLLDAMQVIDGREGVSYIIDPKAIHKDALYGTLDSTTREWTDGLFTSILRRVTDGSRGAQKKRHWIIFDGDVDPEWVENLNSVLDDNKLLTLPNGERLYLPDNVRIVFEVETLRYATPATVSRCGMIWFSDTLITPAMICQQALGQLRSEELAVDDLLRREGGSGEHSNLELQREIVAMLEPMFTPNGLVLGALQKAAELQHIMEFSPARVLATLFYGINKSIRSLHQYNSQHADFPLTTEKVKAFMTNRLLLDVVWAFTGDAGAEERGKLARYLTEQSGIALPQGSVEESLIDFDVDIATQRWVPWQERVPVIEVDTQAVTAADVVIPTIDTARHEDVLYSWILERKPLILCGPPGSGKTMTLMNAIRKLSDVELAGLNFSSGTSPELVLKTFEQYCEYKKTAGGVVLAPTSPSKWLVVFCDEINLPAPDTYGTQRVISFIRQMIEHGGFWRSSDLTWVRLDRIQFVGACNPPTDPGRIPLNNRFLRHAPVLMVDYPVTAGLRQIYGTFSRALLKVVPALRTYAEAMTKAMVDVYQRSQKRFTPDQQAHYVYSPRELTRWVRGVYEALRPLDALDLEGLVRIWAHEGLRLFQDRLVNAEDRAWTDETINSIALESFPNIDAGRALDRPILYSNWTTKDYLPIGRAELKDYMKARLRVFYEEELDVPLVLYDDMLDHVLRIDRVFHQPQGHVLLIGISGSGKTTLARFAAWINGLSIFQIQVSNRYTAADFDEDLRAVLRRAGCKGEKICFIMDESNALDSAFLERMNTLLANAEIPGLFEGDEYSALMNACREGSQRDGLMLDSGDELYRWFTQQISRNLHVVFTMNPPSDGLANRAATSPALFNRCVINWFGDWTPLTLNQVGAEVTAEVDLDDPEFEPAAEVAAISSEIPAPLTLRQAVVSTMIRTHLQAESLISAIGRSGRYAPVITPRHFLDYLAHYKKLFNEKREELEDQQRHINVGLDKLRETVEQVGVLSGELSVTEGRLKEKDQQAKKKLQDMMADQQEAEAKKMASTRIQAELAEQAELISQRQNMVRGELADVEPTVRAAASAVGSIKKQQLAELASLRIPPASVVGAAEACVAILGHHNVKQWPQVLATIRRDDFAYSVQHFDASTLDANLRRRIERDYLSRPDLTIEAVERANKAMTPLLEWVVAQIQYANILDRIGPLRREVAELELRESTGKAQAQAVQENIEQLELSIARFRDEYATLVSETAAIKLEMQKVQEKVDRSTRLLSSLSAEETRWAADSKDFTAEMGTLVGNVLLGAGFLAYCGYFDQHHRELMFKAITRYMAEANIPHKSSLALAEYLSPFDERVRWTAMGLPADSLAMENATMIHRYNRYPLLIDPTGQASLFLRNIYRERKLNVTSFLDASFVKNLESAIRFGTPLLIQDVERLDPVLNPVLNREIRRTGGRNLIRVGTQDIDLSPAFTMFLATGDPSIAIPPDLSSRTTVVNFTMTPGSLESQSLDKTLKSERPDTDNRRRDLTKAQGEYKVQLRSLEKSLLQALNDSTGSILENESLIASLERLKGEAADISSKMKETDTIAAEIDTITQEYRDIARSASAIYFLLERLGELHHFYRFSLKFFLDLFEDVLNRNERLKGVRDVQARKRIISEDLFLVTFERVAQSLEQGDHLVLALALAQLARFSEDVEGGARILRQIDASSIRSVGKGADIAPADKSRVQAILGLARDSKGQASQMQDGVLAGILGAHEPETEIARLLTVEGQDRVQQSALVTALVAYVRPDRLGSALSDLSKSFFGAAFVAKDPGRALDEAAASTSIAASPILLCSPPGYDAAFRVDQLAADKHKRYEAVAMGSAEACRAADRAIAQASRAGGWVLLKNVHLASDWVNNLDKRLRATLHDPGFRLFMTTEINPNIPVGILLQSRVIMNEPAPGVRASLLDSLETVRDHGEEGGPAEKGRLLFLLSWLHAVIQERARYNPVGWSQGYEFNDADFVAAVSTIRRWVNATAKGRTNMDPSSLPWHAIRTLLIQSVYGGRIDSVFDEKVLATLVNKLMSPAAYESDFNLIEDGVLAIPDAITLDQFISWAKALPEANPHTWLGLPSESERSLARSKGLTVLGRLRTLQAGAVEEAPLNASSTVTGLYKPLWMKDMTQQCQTWLAGLPQPFKLPHLGTKPDPVSAFLLRESAVASKLLAVLQQDLSDVAEHLSDRLKQTNRISSVIKALRKGSVPVEWHRYTVRRGVTPAAWLEDFAARHRQLYTLLEKPGSPVNLGLLAQPSGYINATRQVIAQRQAVSLELLRLTVSFDGSVSGDNGGFQIKGLCFEGGRIDGGHLQLTDGASSEVENAYICWKVDAGRPESTVELPIYLNGERKDLIASIDVNLGDGVSASTAIQRGCCLKLAL